MKKNNLILTLMVGIPRSGKSTWIKNNIKSEVIVCPDKIRKVIFGHQFHKDAEDFIWAFAKGMVKLLLGQGKSVIIDATNLNFYTRDEWYKIANNFNASIRIIWIKTSLKECLKRNIRSTDSERLPEKVLNGTTTIFENPSCDLRYKELGYKIKLIETSYKGGYKNSDNIYLDEILKRGKCQY